MFYKASKTCKLYLSTIICVLATSLLLTACASHEQTTVRQHPTSSIATTTTTTDLTPQQLLNAYLLTTSKLPAGFTDLGSQTNLPPSNTGAYLKCINAPTIQTLAQATTDAFMQPGNEALITETVTEFPNAAGATSNLNLLTQPNSLSCLTSTLSGSDNPTGSVLEASIASPVSALEHIGNAAYQYTVRESVVPSEYGRILSLPGATLTNPPPSSAGPSLVQILSQQVSFVVGQIEVNLQLYYSENIGSTSFDLSLLASQLAGSVS